MDLDLNFWRSAVTLVSLALFIGLMVWTWNRRQLKAFDEAAQLPFLDADLAAHPQSFHTSPAPTDLA